MRRPQSDLIVTLPHAQRMRASYIDWRMLTAGSIRRGHLVETFGVSMAQASGDINDFIATYPDALTYDKTAKQYVPGNGRYRSVTGWSPERLAAWQSAAEAGCEWAWPLEKRAVESSPRRPE